MGLVFDTQQPIKMKLLRREPFLEFFAAARVELHKHLSIVHAEQDAARVNRRCGVQPRGQFFRALPRKTSDGVLR